jgi:hypothetical protein
MIKNVIYNHIKKNLWNTSYVQQASYISLQQFFVCKGQIVDLWVVKLQQKEIQINTTTLQFHHDPFNFIWVKKPFPIVCVMHSVKSTKYKFVVNY